MKKYLAAIVLTGLASSMIFGCSENAPEPEKPAAVEEAEEPVEEEAEEAEETIEETSEETAEPEEGEKSENTGEYDAETLDKLLEDTSLFDGKSAKDLGYNWMWLCEEDKVRDGDDVFDLYDANSLMDEKDYVWLSDSVKKADWDNDGIYEYFRPGDINFGGLYFDMSGDVLTAITGYGPYSMGWNEIAYIDDAYWIYDASGNAGKVYRFDRFNEKHELEDTFLYEIHYDENDGGSELISYSKGKDYENMGEISQEEFEKVCGDNGLINEPLPELESNKDQELTDKINEAVKEFFEGKRPVLVKYEG